MKSTGAVKVVLNQEAAHNRHPAPSMEKILFILNKYRPNSLKSTFNGVSKFMPLDEILADISVHDVIELGRLGVFIDQDGHLAVNDDMSPRVMKPEKQPKGKASVV